MGGRGEGARSNARLASLCEAKYLGGGVGGVLTHLARLVYNVDRPNTTPIGRDFVSGLALARDRVGRYELKLEKC